MQTTPGGNSHSSVTRKTKPVIEQVSDIAHQTVDKAIGAVAPSADWLNEQSESLNANRKKLLENTSAYISENPLKTIGIAVVAGFILSRFIRT